MGRLRMALCRRLVIAGAATLALIATGFAQTFPSRPVRLIVPYAAGGGTDAIARIVAQAMSEKLGQTIVVENIATGAGNVATVQAAAAAPDGYTVLMANQGPIAVNPHIMKGIKVDTLTAFDPVTQIASAPLVVVVPPASPFATIGELIDAARKNPGKISYGSAGNGSASHLAAVLLNVTAQIETLHVPYRGAGPAIADLLGGQTQFMVTTFPSVIGLIETGKMRALAVTTKQRSPLLRDVPTIAENGYPAYEAGAWYGLAVPAGTPRPVVEVLHKAAVDASAVEAVRRRLLGDGSTPVGSSPEQFGAFMKAEYARWKSIVAAAKLRIN